MKRYVTVDNTPPIFDRKNVKNQKNYNFVTKSVEIFKKMCYYHNVSEKNMKLYIKYGGIKNAI